LLGADAYVNGNLGTGSAQEMSEWVEYMTSDSKSTLANLRRKNGRDKPFKVAYFAVGNEAWGCGGNMNAAVLRHLYKNVRNLPACAAQYRPKMIASGGNDDDASWTDVLSKELKADRRHQLPLLHHPDRQMGRQGRCYRLQGKRMDLHHGQHAAHGRPHPEKRRRDRQERPGEKIGLFVDEWGTWYDVEKGTNAGFLFQQNTLRDAVVAALNFNIFHAHADRVRMTNIAQMVNVLQAMIITDKDKMLLTPTYHAFEMYVPFQDATSLPVTLKDNPKYAARWCQRAGISASAARGTDGKLYLALVNTNPNQARPMWR
jgi:alpha-N-arabinofuranosidase